jgi:hypothetical protein
MLQVLELPHASKADTPPCLRKSQFDLGLWGVVLWRWAGRVWAVVPRCAQRAKQGECVERSSNQACTNDARVCWSCVRTKQASAPSGGQRLGKEAGKARIRPQRGVCWAIE